MATPFATAADLAARGWSGSASADRIDQALASASDYLRGEIGWQVYPVATAVVSVRSWTDVVSLPGSPIQSVTGVTADGDAVVADDYELDGSWLHLASGSIRVAVTYVVGYTDPPTELVDWTCVLAADDLSRDGDESPARPASEALADWRVAYSQRQQEGERPIPLRVLERLRSTYGTSAFVTS